MPRLQHVVERHCDTVTEFLQFVSPRSRPVSTGPWLYRGHPDAAYELVPAALRDDSNALREFMPGSGFSTTEDQILGEWVALQGFYHAADLAGLSIPGDDHLVRNRLEKGRFTSTAWPSDELLPLMAIAQHHGLPTRLLDWSRNPLKAAYFAASGAAAVDSKSSSGRIAVWILSLWLFEIDDEYAPLKVVTAPTCSNPNLYSQEGVFTRTARVIQNKNPIDRRPVNKIIESEINSFTPFGTPLFHVTLPVDLAGQLLWELNRDGINRAKLFPDYYAVVAGLKEARLFRMP